MQDQPLIKIRVCKNCNIIKNLQNDFPKNRNKNENAITYRHTCSTCSNELKIEHNRLQYMKIKDKLKKQYQERKQLKEINQSNYIV